MERRVSEREKSTNIQKQKSPKRNSKASKVRVEHFRIKPSSKL
jgi:hypothetical protein